MGERIDIFDKHGIPTGRVVDRATDYELSRDEYKLAVGMWIVDGGGRIFLTKRSMEKSFAPGKWENPAGHVRSGEDPVSAIVRELEEETGIRIAPEQITLLGDSCTWPYLGKDYGVRMYMDVKDVRFQKGETTDAKWVDFDEFLAMRENGDFTPSMFTHMEGYKQNFLRFLGRENDLRL